MRAEDGPSTEFSRADNHLGTALIIFMIHHVNIYTAVYLI